MYLVDTSVWIDYLRGISNRAVETLDEILASGLAVGLCHAVYQEILQGAQSEAELGRLDSYFRTQRFYAPREPLATHRGAALLYYRCRRQGVSPRSTLDCLIAQLAIEHNLALLHNDRDFDLIASVIPELKLA